MEITYEYLHMNETEESISEILWDGRRFGKLVQSGGIGSLTDYAEIIFDAHKREEVEAELEEIRETEHLEYEIVEAPERYFLLLKIFNYIDATETVQKMLVNIYYRYYFSYLNGFIKIINKQSPESKRLYSGDKE